MAEKVYTGLLVKELRRVPGSLTFKHADSITGGIPDVSFTFSGRTIWIETKVFRGKSFKISIQHENMRKLSAFGQAIYVIFDEDLDATFIALPSHFTNYRENFLAKHYMIAPRWAAETIQELFVLKTT